MLDLEYEIKLAAARIVAGHNDVEVDRVVTLTTPSKAGQMLQTAYLQTVTEGKKLIQKQLQATAAESDSSSESESDSEFVSGSESDGTWYDAGGEGGNGLSGGHWTVAVAEVCWIAIPP